MNDSRSSGVLPLLLLACVGACGNNSQNGPTDPEVEVTLVGSVEIQELFFTDTRNRHTGDTLTLTARVRDTRGNLLTDRPVSWLSRNIDRATIRSGGLLTVRRTVSISQDGIFADPRRVAIVATADGVADSVTLAFNGWSLGRSTDPVTLAEEAQTNLGALIGAEGPPRLHVRCASGRLDVFVSVTFVTGSGRVEYRFSGQEPVTEVWNEAEDFSAVFYPAPNDSTFALRLTQSDTLLFRIDKFSGADVLATFVLPGASEVVPLVIGACS